MGERSRSSDVCPHTTIYVSSYYYVCVLIVLYMRSVCGGAGTTEHVLELVLCICVLYICLHTAIYVSSFYYICVLILQYGHLLTRRFR